MGEADTIVGERNGWGNKSTTPSAPCTLGIPGGADVMMTQHATTLTVGGNAHMEGTQRVGGPDRI